MATQAPEQPSAQELICDYTQWEGCMDIIPPKVVTTQNMPWFARGLYVPGEPYIFVYSKLPLKTQWEVEVHETVHYLQTKLGMLGKFSRAVKCHTENDARALTSLILGTPYDHTWRERYGCDIGEEKKKHESIRINLTRIPAGG